ncbi:hypothetical protein [Legionella sp. km772]|uniref:hypothetical protein n=1 Tax=Legionella sp. km772 TaxID=2498111 RepID=UPI000F8E9993|nr:hypothetical protein [Legionella sp. km772]RUR07052.1 hypothetical protein ELY15_12610 [Legionella sp. km772]
MKIPFLKRKISAGILLFLVTNMAQAGITFFSFVPLIFLNLFTTVTTTTPFFTFIPVMLTGSKTTIIHPSIRYPQTTLLQSKRKPGIQRIVRLTPITTPNIVVPQNGRKIIKYRVTNFSTKPTILRLKPVRGIRQIVNAGSCTNLFSLRYRQSCILNLQVNGTMLANNIVGGPVLCEPGSIRCYQPTHGHRLNVKLIKKMPTVGRKYTVGGTVIGLKNGILTLVLNGNTPISIPRNGRFTFSTPIAQGKSYRVNIKTHPQHQICKITNNSGTINRTGITNVLVSCIEERKDVSINLANSESDEAAKSSSSTPSVKTSAELTKNDKANPYKNDLVDYPLSLPDTTADNVEPAISEDRPRMPVNSDNSILIHSCYAHKLVV